MSDAPFPAGPLARRLPNLLDLVAAACIFGAIAYVALIARGTFAPLSAPEATTIHLDPAYLPGYAVRTTLRMFAALVCSLLFTFTYAPWAAKSRRAGLILIPVLDILQAVPILGFLSFTVVFFLSLFPGRVLGPELAAIFAVFTGQAWNMTFSLYQSLRTVPADLDEAARGLQLTPWQRFWRLEVPFAMPGLVWNMMMSVSAGWFFVVASEAISVGDITWKLPGVGSYVAVALDERDLPAVGWAILTMLVVIVLYDQLLFRPLVAWSSKFLTEATASAELEDPWLLKLVRRTRALRRAGDALGEGIAWIGGRRLHVLSQAPAALPRLARRAGDGVFYAVLVAAAGFGLWEAWRFLGGSLGFADLAKALRFGVYTLIRVALMLGLSTVIWVPVGVWLGLRPALARAAQPLAQFASAFPANLFFPVFVVVIVHFGLNPDVWLTPLMLLAMQWYILFNVVAGAAAFPGDLREAAQNLRVGGWLWWRRVVLPGIFPYYVTGAITAAGSAWNASIVSEVASWGNVRLVAHGLGAYIADATFAGDTARLVLGIAVMAGFVVVLNLLLWRPLYEYANRRFLFG